MAVIDLGKIVTTVDSVLNGTSTNPPENKAVYAEIGKKVDKEEGKGLIDTNVASFVKYGGAGRLNLYGDVYVNDKKLTEMVGDGGKMTTFEVDMDDGCVYGESAEYSAYSFEIDNEGNFCMALNNG